MHRNTERPCAPISLTIKPIRLKVDRFNTIRAKREHSKLMNLHQTIDHFSNIPEHSRGHIHIKHDNTFQKSKRRKLIRESVAAATAATP